MKPWREASTLILAARTSALKSVTSAGIGNRKQSEQNSNDRSNGSQQNEDYKVLFLKRSPKSKFMPSRLVFPGGATHSADWSAEWQRLFADAHGQNIRDLMSEVERGKKPPMVSTNNGRAEDCRNTGVSADVAFRICAIRETFEECGLLLCLDKSAAKKLYGNSTVQRQPWLWNGNSHVLKSGSNRLSAESLEKWRNEVQASPPKFIEMCNSLGLVPNIASLIQWRNWLTPVVEERLRVKPKPGDDADIRIDNRSGQDSSSVKKKSMKLPRRFDTMFYMCCIDCDNLPETSADETETTKAEWYRPSELLGLISQGSHGGAAGTDTPRPHHVAPPQIYELSAMKQHKTLDSLHLYASDQVNKDVAAQCWMPDFRSSPTGGIVTLLPGDYKYPTDIDYEGTDVGGEGEPFRPPALELLSEDQMRSLRLNRIVYSDQSFQNGTVICNVI